MTLGGGEGKAREATEGRRDCPFCPGNERDTPNEVYAVREPGCDRDGPGWTLRVVPNKFPAVRADSETGFGFHELAIETERHVADPAALTADELTRVLIAYRERFQSLHGIAGVRDVIIFKNVGAEAGASLAHTHSQIVALPFLSAPLKTKLQHCEAYLHTHGRSLWDDYLQQATTAGRVVSATDRFALLTAYAPRMSFEMLLMPCDDAADFGQASDESLQDCAELLKAGVTALDRAAHRPAYNWWLHAAPPNSSAVGFRWHFEILPRTARIAGFEWASDAFIVSASPEAAAARLRTAMEDENRRPATILACPASA